MAKGSQGFTLIQVMVTSVIAMAIIYAIFQALQISMKAQQQAQVKQNLSSLQSTIRAILNSDRACEMNFYQTSIKDGVESEVSVYMPDAEGGRGEVLAQKDLKKHGVTFKKVYLKRVGPLGQNHFLTKLIIEAENQGSHAIKPLEFTLNTITDNSEKIQNCYGESSSGNSCIGNGGEFSDNYKCLFSAQSCKKVGMKLKEDQSGCELDMSFANLNNGSGHSKGKANGNHQNGIAALCAQFGLKMNAAGNDCEASAEDLKKIMGTFQNNLKDMQETMKKTQ